MYDIAGCEWIKNSEPQKLLQLLQLQQYFYNSYNTFEPGY